MRDYLNGILSFIGAESLTDEEFDSVVVTDQSDHQAVYEDLLAIIESRELVSDTVSRLTHYFQAMGVPVTNPNTAVSEIFVGAVLDEC
jgi:hypothetical protein